MKKILLLLMTSCAVWVSGCVMVPVVKTGPMNMADVSAGVTATPLAADVIISKQKVKGEASGLAMDSELLVKEAVAKALGQDPPNVEGADVLAALEVFTEKTNEMMRVTVTGYPAWYINFRKAGATDSTYLIITGSGDLKSNGGK